MCADKSIKKITNLSNAFILSINDGGRVYIELIGNFQWNNRNTLMMNLNTA